MILQPRGYNGVALESNAPLQYSHADILVLRVVCIKRFIVNSVCNNRLSHIYFGNYGSTPDIIARKCALNVLIALSNIFRLCTFCGNS